MRLGLGLGIGVGRGGAPAALALSPSSLSCAAFATQTFVASGGSGGGYVFSLSAAPSGGYIDPSGNYVAGPFAGTDVVHVVDSASNAVSVNVVVAVLAGLAAGYIADLGITITGSGVSTWADQSGSADANKNATQATNASRPTRNLADVAYNGQATLSLNGSQYLSSALWSAALAQPYTAYAAGHTAQAGGLEAFYDSALGPGESTMQAQSTPSRIGLYGGSFITTTEDMTTPKVCCGVENGASSAIYVNDHTTAVVTGSIGTTGLTSVILGALQGGGSNWNGKIAFELFVVGSQSLTQRAAAMNWAGKKYGIGVT